MRIASLVGGPAVCWRLGSPPQAGWFQQLEVAARSRSTAPIVRLHRERFQAGQKLYGSPEAVQATRGGAHSGQADLQHPVTATRLSHLREASRARPPAAGREPERAHGVAARLARSRRDAAAVVLGDLLTSARPRPLPPVFVEKNGSKTRSRASGSRPGPVVLDLDLDARRPAAAAAAPRSSPRSPTACRAFSIRLTTARSSSRRSPSTPGTAPSSDARARRSGGSDADVGRDHVLAPARAEVHAARHAAPAGARRRRTRSRSRAASAPASGSSRCRLSSVAAKSAPPVGVDAPQVLGGELDRRQRVLDLVGHLARHLGPGGQPVAALEVAPLPVQVAGHLVEGLDQVAQLVLARRASRAPRGRRAAMRRVASVRSRIGPEMRRAIDWASSGRGRRNRIEARRIGAVQVVEHGLDLALRAAPAGSRGSPARPPRERTGTETTR